MRDFRREAAAEGISQRAMSMALDGMTPDQGVISRDRKQGFFAQSFLDFSAKLATPNRVHQRHARRSSATSAAFDRAVKEYGVAPCRHHRLLGP